MKLATKTGMIEVFAWAFLAFLGASAMRVFRPMPLSDDSYQYLNVAEHIKHDHQLSTSLVHFDTERSHGRIPAPLTTFAPGYPAVVAITSFSWSLEGAARVLSCVCYAGTAGLLVWALIRTGVTMLFRQLTLVLFATNATALSFATAVMTEPLYMLLTTVAIVGLVSAEKTALPKPVVIAQAVIAFSAAGLAFWVRYAGLFLIAAVVSYALLRLLRPGSRFRTVFLLAALIPVVLAASMMLRNLVAVGTWKGGNDMPVRNPFKGVMAEYVRAQLHLILGQHPVTFDVWLSLLLVGGLGVAALLITAVLKGGASKTGWWWLSGWRRLDAAALLVGICVFVYSAGIFYAGLRTVISFGPRMFLPVLPLYLLLLGMGVNWLMSRWPAAARSAWLKTGLLLVTVGYVGVNARNLYERPSPARHEILALQYAKPAADGLPLLEWVESNIPADDVIVAADGQATGYLLHRPTLSLVGPHFSSVRWGCDEIRKQMKRFNASYLFLYKPSSEIDKDALLAESQLLATPPQQPPCGFVIAAENSNIRILKSAELVPQM
jgi:hypothetical protein